MSWLSRLRKKPKLVREQVAFFAAVFVSGLIGAIWAATLPGHFSKLDLEDAPEKEAIGAFSRFFSEVKTNTASAIKASFSGSDEESTTSKVSTSTEEAAVLPTREGIVVPDLKPENVNQINKPKPKVVLIGTTTSSTTPKADFD